jgi:phosphate uptake regulator
MEAEFVKVRNDYVSLRPHPSPRVERYLRMMGRKLSTLTNGTYELISRYDSEMDREIWILRYCDIVPSKANRIYAFSILEMLEDMLQVLATLHREMCIRDDILPDNFFLREEGVQPVEVVPVQPVIETVTILGDINE